MEFDCTKEGKNIYFACREKAAKYNDLLNSRERAAMAIRYAHVGSILENMDEVIDYDELKLNGNSANITFSILQIPILGEVTVDGNIL